MFRKLIISAFAAVAMASPAMAESAVKFAVTDIEGLEALQQEIQNEGATVVFVVEDDRFVPRSVSVGATGRTTVQVVDGLATGDRVANEGSFLVKADLTKGAVEHTH